MELNMLNTIRLLFITLLYLISSLTQPSFAELYKCKDNKSKIIYSDKPCFKTTSQELEIVDSTIDLSIATKLYKQKQEENNNRFSSKKRDKAKKINKGKVISIKTKKESMECKSYKEYIRNGKKQLKSGFTISEGKRIKRSIDEYSKLYDTNCK